MTGSDLIGPAVVAAVVSAAISAINIIISTRTTNRIHSEKLEFDEALAEKKFRFDCELAERRFQYDRDLYDLKRKVEFGEDVLAGFYKIRDIITAVRSPLAYGEEGGTRKRAEGESEEVAKTRDTYFVPLERLNKNAEFLSEFFSKRYRARTVFWGTDLDRAFELLNEVIVAIQVSAGMMIRTAGDDRRDNKFWAAREADIWDGYGDEHDRLAPRVKSAVEIANAVIGSALEAAARLPNVTAKQAPAAHG